MQAAPRPKRAALHVAIEEPVKRRVPLNAGFGKDDEIGVFLSGLLDGVDDAGGVSFEVAVGGVDLADSDAHVGLDWWLGQWLSDSGERSYCLYSQLIQLALYSNPNCGGVA